MLGLAEVVATFSGALDMSVVSYKSYANRGDVPKGAQERPAIGARRKLVANFLGRSVSICLFLVLGDSCTQNSDSGLPVQLTTTRVFTSETSPSFATSHLEIRIDGIIPVNFPCYTFAGVASISADTIYTTIVASVKQGGGVCQQVPAFYSFTLRVESVPAGSYIATLKYRYQGGPPEYERLVAAIPIMVP